MRSWCVVGRLESAWCVRVFVPRSIWLAGCALASVWLVSAGVVYLKISYFHIPNASDIVEQQLKLREWLYHDFVYSASYSLLIFSCVYRIQSRYVQDVSMLQCLKSNVTGWRQSRTISEWTREPAAANANSVATFWTRTYMFRWCVIFSSFYFGLICCSPNKDRDDAAFDENEKGKNIVSGKEWAREKWGRGWIKDRKGREQEPRKFVALAWVVAGLLCSLREFGILCVPKLMGLSQFNIKLCVPQTNDFACRSGFNRLNRDDSADIHK